MLNENKIEKSTLKIFYFAYILTSLGGLIFMENVNMIVFGIQILTLLITVIFFILIYILENYKTLHHISIIFYGLIVLTGMWQGLGSASILYLTFSITYAQVLILTFKGNTRLGYLLVYTILTGFFLLYDYMFRANDPEIQIFSEGRLIGVTIIITGMLFILIINRIFVEDLLKQLKNYSYFDVLTSTKNSRAFYEEIKVYDSDYHRYNINYVLVYIDIDNYKDINDTHGHLVGDKVLEEFTKTVRTSIRPGDELYRIGGDEFVLILQNISLDLATQKIESMHYRIISTDILDQHIEFSYGIVSKDASDADVDVLLHSADKLMYENKLEKK